MEVLSHCLLLGSFFQTSIQVWNSLLALSYSITLHLFILNYICHIQQNHYYVASMPSQILVRISCDPFGPFK